MKAKRFTQLIAARALRLRRGLIYALHPMLRASPRFRPPEELVSALKSGMRVPYRVASQTAHRVVRHDLLFGLEWLALGSRSYQGLLQDSRHFSVPDADIFEWAAKQRSVVLGTLHMGAYPIAIAYLIHTYFRDRTLIVFKTLAPTNEEMDAIDALRAVGVDLEVFMLTPDADLLPLFRHLRRGAILLTLVDLPSSYGRSIPAELLWRTSLITVGCVDVSAACGIPLLLFRTDSRWNGETITAEPAIFVDGSDASRKDASVKLLGFINDSIRAAPEQWHLWERLEEFDPLTELAA